MHPFFRRHWFLLLLLGVLAIGMAFAPELVGPLSQFPRGWLVALVMFITALPMSLSQITGAISNRRAVGLALLLSIVAAPPLAWVIARVLNDQLGIGLIVAACVPCTLASAAVWTRRGGGNDAIALVVTLVTNLACFLVLPGWLSVLLGKEDYSLDAGALSLRLLMLVVAPVMLAQLLRSSGIVMNWAGKYRVELSTAAQLGMLAMVLFGAVSAGNMLRTIEPGTVNLMEWSLMIGCVLGSHLLLFAAGWIGCRALGEPHGNQLAVAIAGSQKTLMIGLDVALAFGGLAILPMVAYHIIQLVVDTMLVDRLGVKETD
ncbi:bile acid:sodium symporter family protein [Aeoliella mucimassa]|uniref:Sodium Bile acid symporter family protein n=1 Tax=Aeoliella mucimassa TaxID=2527972 RepID=A0A518AKA0_9BACT|nr:bile acid:sodium symporter [Aeoliella mucimassa]QDU55116.1 Sodium Bile acid symporter family protein [Aeoliella mucimassa]